MPFNFADTQLIQTLAGPNAAQTVTSSAIDLGEVTSQADFVAQAEALLTAPALTTSQLADTKTVTWDLICSANADLSSPTVLVAGAIVQLGAGGVGAAGATYRYRPATTIKRYFGFRATGVASGGNASTASGTLQLLF